MNVLREICLQHRLQQEVEDEKTDCWGEGEMGEETFQGQTIWKRTK